MDSLNILGLIFAVVGFAYMVYQQTVIQEGKKQRGRMQYALASINNSAIGKQIAWQNRMRTLHELKTQSDWELGNTLMRGRDDFIEISGLAMALEGIIDSDKSAIQDMMQRSIDMTKLNNELQTEASKNPTILKAPSSNS
jgi:hypothetical protein